MSIFSLKTREDNWWVRFRLTHWMRNVIRVTETKSSCIQWCVITLRNVAYKKTEIGMFQIKTMHFCSDNFSCSFLTQNHIFSQSSTSNLLDGIDNYCDIIKSPGRRIAIFKKKKFSSSHLSGAIFLWTNFITKFLFVRGKSLIYR